MEDLPRCKLLEVSVPAGRSRVAGACRFKTELSLRRRAQAGVDQTTASGDCPLQSVTRVNI